MPNRIVRADAVLRAASEHLHYEYSMFITLTKALASGICNDGVMKNAMIESFTVHARVLLYVLFADKPWEDDVIAEDFLMKPEEWPQIRGEIGELLELVNQRVGKEIAHLTYARLDISQDTKGWDFAQIANAVKAVMDLFIKQVPPDRLGHSWTPRTQ